MPQASTEQEPQAESLPANAEATQVESAPTQPVDTGEQTTPAPASDATSPPEVTGQPKDDRPRDEQGRFAPKQPETSPADPVQEAIAKLARPEKAKPASTPAPAGKPAPEAKPATAKPTQDATTTSTPVDDLDAPEAERAAWKQHTRERFDKVLTTLRTEREARAAETPFVQKGKEFDGLLTEYGLQEDVGFVPKEHIAGLISVQASVNRGLIALQQGRIPAPKDREALATFGQTVDQLRAQFGVQTATPQAQAPVPFAGELPADLKDLVEVYGIDEKRVRLLAALEAKAPAAAQAPTQQPPQPTQAPAAPQAPAKPEGVDMDALYGRRLMAEISAAGDQNAAQTMRVLLAHPATKNEVMRKFPGTTPADVPAVFNAMDPRDRYEVLKAAHAGMTKQVPARPSSTPPPATTNRSVSTTATPRRAAPDANSDPVAAAIAFMARE